MPDHSAEQSSPIAIAAADPLPDADLEAELEDAKASLAAAEQERDALAASLAERKPLLAEANQETARLVAAFSDAARAGDETACEKILAQQQRATLRAKMHEDALAGIRGDHAKAQHAVAEAQADHAFAQALRAGQKAVRIAENFGQHLLAGAADLGEWKEELLSIKKSGGLSAMDVHGAINPFGHHMVQAMAEAWRRLGVPLAPGLTPQPLAEFTKRLIKDIRRPDPEKFHKPATHPPGQPPEPPPGQRLVTKSGILKDEVYRQPERAVADTTNIQFDPTARRFFYEHPVTGVRVWLAPYDERVLALLRKMAGEGEEA